MLIFRVSPRDTRAWKTTFDVISQFITEGILQFRERGIEFEALDPSMILFVRMFYPKEGFSVYELKHPIVNVPLPLSELQRILGRVQQSANLILELHGSTLKIYIEGERSIKEYLLPVIDMEPSPVAINLPQEGAKIIALAEDIRDALRDVGVVSKQVTVGVKDGKLYFESVEGNSKAKTVIERANVDASSNVKSVYPLDYLSSIVRGAEDEISMVVGEDSPIRIDYRTGDARLMFVLAPILL